MPEGVRSALRIDVSFRAARGRTARARAPMEMEPRRVSNRVRARHSSVLCSKRSSLCTKLDALCTKLDTCLRSCLLVKHRFEIVVCGLTMLMT